ncbi:hypothetical protein ACF0H5_003052 [Mactra antiquata]
MGDSIVRTKLTPSIQSKTMFCMLRTLRRIKKNVVYVKYLILTQSDIMACCRPSCEGPVCDVCEFLKPPPLPPRDFPGYEEIVYYVRNNTTYREYAIQCNVQLPEVNTGSSTTVTYDTTVSTSSQTAIATTDDESADKANVALPVLLVLFFIALIIAGFLLYWWWRKRSRKRDSANINSLPLKKYENTNYLANKAVADQCWKQQGNKQNSACTPGNQYGSFPPDGDVKANNDFKVNNELSNERKDSIEKLPPIGYMNENFVVDDDGGTRSPGVDSQTPLCDMVDSVLPNEVLPSDTEIQEAQSDYSFKIVEVHLENDKNNSSQNMPISEAVNGEVMLRSPKKKKKYLTKSTPVDEQADNSKNLAQNRKTV